MHPTVSVVIPVFNGAAFIARAVQSALDQRLPPLEVIVVNDGSTDGTMAALAGFCTAIKRISIPNGGVSHARNVGMQACRGELIAFLDADDVWHPDKLAYQVAALCAYPQAGFCCCNYLVLDKHRGRMVEHFSAFAKNKELVFDRPLVASALETLIAFNFVGTASTVMIRRTVIEATGLFNVHYRQAEDYDYWLRCARVTPFLVLSASLMEKKSHDTNLTNNSLETCLCHEQVLLALQARDLARPGSQRAIARAIGAALAAIDYEIANRLFDQGAAWRAFAYYCKGMRSRWSWSNFSAFSVLVCKKMARLLGLKRVHKPGAAQARLP